MDLAAAQVLSIYKAAQIIVVYKNKGFIFATFKIVVLSLECSNNSQKLIFVDLISSSYQNHFLGKESYWILLAQIISN